MRRSDLSNLIGLITSNYASSDLQLMSIANAFRQSLKKPLPAHWSISACFEDLSNFFIESPHIENHMKWAMYCWYEKLNTILSNTMTPRDLIILGHALLDKPYQFSAFIYWLCEHGVYPEELVDSYLLHRYFAYHCATIDETHDGYALLMNESETIDAFLEEIKKTPCGLRGFINKKENGGYYSSYNLSGESVIHSEECIESPIQRLETPTNQTLPWKHDVLQNKTVEFYQLFGWQFIDTLKPSTSIHKSCFLELLHTPEITEQILLEFERHALNNMSYSLVEIFLHYAGEFIEEELEVNKISLVKKIPFLIHAIDINNYEKNFIAEIMQLLCSCSRYNDINHISPLVALHRQAITIDEESIDEQTMAEKIIEMIFRIILPHGNMLPDEITNVLMTINNYLIPLIEKEINDYTNKLNELISGYAAGKEQYSDVEQQWVSKLSIVNLFIYLHPEIRDRMNDSLCNKFDFKANILFAVFSWQSKRNQSSNFVSTLQEICTDRTEIKKLLQKTLLKNSNMLFIRSIIAYVVSHDSLVCFLYQPIDNKKNLFQYAIDSKNEVLSREILSAKGITEKNWEDIFYEAIRSNNKSMIQSLCAFQKKKNLSDRVIIEAAKIAASICNWDIAQLLCGLQNDSTKNPPIHLTPQVKLYLELLDRESNKDFSTSLFRITNEHQDTLLHLAAKTRHFQTVSKCLRLLCAYCTVFEVQAYLAQTDHDERLAYCPGKCQIANQINTLLTDMRQRFSNLPCHEMERSKRERPISVHSIVMSWTRPISRTHSESTLRLSDSQETRDEETRDEESTTNSHEHS